MRRPVGRRSGHPRTERRCRRPATQSGALSRHGIILLQLLHLLDDFQGAHPRRVGRLSFRRLRDGVELRFTKPSMQAEIAVVVLRTKHLSVEQRCEEALALPGRPPVQQRVARARLANLKFQPSIIDDACVDHCAHVPGHQPIHLRHGVHNFDVVSIQHDLVLHRRQLRLQERLHTVGVIRSLVCLQLHARELACRLEALAMHAPDLDEHVAVPTRYAHHQERADAADDAVALDDDNGLELLDLALQLLERRRPRAVQAPRSQAAPRVQADNSLQVRRHASHDAAELGVRHAEVGRPIQIRRLRRVHTLAEFRRVLRRHAETHHVALQCRAQLLSVDGDKAAHNFRFRLPDVLPLAPHRC
mmetsp:Transcript_93950/g.287473  ORF Transcript_93950/g.287473 Transcript_93950/m.287473 type:complete len:360 (-) Transcript_93950:1693-2772(-)